MTDEDFPQDPEQASKRARCIIEQDLGKIDCIWSDEPRYKAKCIRKIMASITFHTAKYEEEYPVSRPLPVSHVPKIETDDWYQVAQFEPVVVDKNEEESDSDKDIFWNRMEGKMKWVWGLEGIYRKEWSRYIGCRRESVLGSMLHLIISHQCSRTEQDGPRK